MRADARGQRAKADRGGCVVPNPTQNASNNAQEASEVAHETTVCGLLGIVKGYEASFG
jgi:hypothetical protein